MNCKEHNLPELELATGQVREALQCILHTILFIRSPGPVTPQDTELEFFQFNYTKIANEAKIEKRVDDAIESFLRSLSQIGPELLSVSPVLSVLYWRETFSGTIPTSINLQRLILF